MKLLKLLQKISEDQRRNQRRSAGKMYSDLSADERRFENADERRFLNI